MRLLLALICFTTAFSIEAGVVKVAPGDDIRAAASRLRPGDELVFREGVYRFNSRFLISAVGSETRPITIRAEDGENVVIEMQTSRQNVLDVRNSQYLIVKNLRFRKGSHGIRLINSSHITIEDNEIFEVGDVGISANAGEGVYEGLIIRRNHIHHTNATGEGIYLGCNRNACRVMNALVEGNYIHHTNGSSVSQGDGIEVKEGSAGNVIRDNVIHDTKYPGVITYSTAGNGPPNIIEGNLIWNTEDNAIQSAADAIIRNNVVLGSPIALQRHQSGRPSNQLIVHNTVINDGSAINVYDAAGAVVIANNAVYSSGGPAIRVVRSDASLVTLAGNVGRGGVSGPRGGFEEGGSISADLVDASYPAEPPIDVFPKRGSALIGAGSSDYASEVDFNGSSRDGTVDAGAYRFSEGGNPGWALAPGFKAGVDQAEAIQ